MEKEYYRSGTGKNGQRFAIERVYSGAAHPGGKPRSNWYLLADLDGAGLKRAPFVCRRRLEIVNLYKRVMNREARIARIELSEGLFPEVKIFNVIN